MTGARRLLARLHEDERGNILVVSVASSLLLVGMVWLIIGTGAKIVQKETMQTAADASAFSASVLKAKGLNILAFLNLVMAIIIAIIICLRFLKAALQVIAVGISICAALIFVPVIPELCQSIISAGFDNFAFNTFPNVESKIENVAHKVLDGVSKAEDGVARAMPVLAFAQAYATGADNAYQRVNYGSAMFTVAWPLPTDGLPVQRGTCNDLKDQAQKDVKVVMEGIANAVCGFLHIGGDVCGHLAGLFADVINGVGSFDLCNGTMDTEVTEKIHETDCQKCKDADKVLESHWEAVKVVRNRDMPDCPMDTNADGSLSCHQDPAGAGTPPQYGYGAGCKVDKNNQCLPQDVNHGDPPIECAADGMPDIKCSSPNWVSAKKGPGCVDTSKKTIDGEFRFTKFDYCVLEKKTKKTIQMDNWPPPMILKQNWKDARDTEAYTVITDSGMAERRKAPAMAAKGGAGGAPLPVPSTLAFAQAEFYEYNHYGNEDLWHMDWRARLVPFTFGKTDAATGDTANGPSAGAVNKVKQMVEDFLNRAGGSGQGTAEKFKDQFILH